jgi:[ribosomal protein S5]-alanine N-acetyltransferase
MEYMLETDRLFIQPLSYNQLLKYVKNDNSLEAELNLNKISRSISAELKEALEQTILPNVFDASKNYLFSTLWTVILKKENKMVADLCFVGEPNSDGEIEIGYGTYEAFRNNGYMREAVCRIIEWAKTQSNVKSIIASTEKDNVSSYSILEKNNFIKSGETDDLLNWRLILRT